MEIPLNIIHDYIGIPVLGLLAYDLLKRHRQRPNYSTHLLGLACTYFTVTVIAFSLPVLLTHNTQLLSVGTFVGDCFQAAAFLCLWLLVIRAFLGNKPVLSKVATGLVIILTIVSMAEAIHRNLTPPYSTELIRTASNMPALTYNDSLAYQILAGLHGLSLLFTGAYFWRQGKEAPTKSQALRIRSIALAFLAGSSIFVIAPGFPVEDQLQVIGVGLSIVFLILGASTVIGRIMKRQENSTPAAPSSET